MANQARILVFMALIGSILNVCAPSHASYTLDEWADAIYRAEGGHSATYLYGIRSVKYKDEAEARQICKNTIYNTLIKYRESRCKEGEDDLSCLSRRYAPINADNDPKGLNANWKKNVKYWIER